jgi:hypothetical protein
MIAYVNFQGPPEVWQEFCRKATKLYGYRRPLQSIYLQKLDAEFEKGEIVAAPPTHAQNVGQASERLPQPSLPYKDTTSNQTQQVLY